MAIVSVVRQDLHGYVRVFGTLFGLPFAAAAVGLAIAGLVITAVDRDGIAPRPRMLLQATGFAIIGVSATLVAVDLYMLFAG